jgi:hyaluronoglucosaminidase
LAIAITPDGKTVYVTNFNEGSGGTVTPISTATGKAGRPIKVGPGPSAIAIAPLTPGGPPTSCMHTVGQL